MKKLLEPLLGWGTEVDFDVKAEITRRGELVTIEWRGGKLAFTSQQAKTLGEALLRVAAEPEPLSPERAGEGEEGEA